VVFWHIWEVRNEARNSDVKQHPSRTGGKSLAYVDLIKQHLYKNRPQPRCESIPSATIWSPPPLGTVLVNSDAAIFEAAGGMSAGVIMRDHQGTCLLACRQYFEGLLSPEHAEALALRHAVQLARDEGRDKVIFASDCLSLVQRLNSSGIDRSSVGLVVSDIKQMATDFYEVSFRHVKRVLNEAAHLLAKSCNNVNSSCVFYSVPKLIWGTLCIDVA
jgi:ribonuclease HI